MGTGLLGGVLGHTRSGCSRLDAAVQSGFVEASSTFGLQT